MLPGRRLDVTIGKWGQIANILRGDLVVPFDVFRTRRRAERHQQISAESIVVWVLILKKTLDLKRARWSVAVVMLERSNNEIEKEVGL